ncbi:hypothetical protein LEP1GSC047_2694 [Leptospira inadai serovar Lyme str. 10]|uniref:Uncharacterized protein n=2 Tax=Leptospira inadai serovar Lyme TaxID=293084 RepID=V6HB95_9LEPT|nr:hypothetical protein [Leptospira inadai]EQA36851.1 hypothetical protein LEP1GSC047_2694 [Leptospira inadai serovar Lyme str. 10]PNV76508.1 hypothetical protein BES34_002650 [Leptospira inadai serovar Lyme]
MKIGVLLSHPKDLSYVKKKLPAEVHLYAHEIQTALFLPDEKISYFFEPSSSSNELEQLTRFLTFNWHRDEEGADFLFAVGISPGQIMAGSLWVAFASFYREWDALKRLFSVRNLDKLLVSKNENERFLRIIQRFPANFEIFDPGHNEPSLIPSCNDRILGSFPFIDARAAIVSLIQKPILGNLKGKTLFLSEWTFKKRVVRWEHTLLMNGKNILKSAYISGKSDFENEGEARFPSTLPETINGKLIFDKITLFGQSWDQALCDLIAEDIQLRYKRYRSYFIKTWSIYRSLLERYKPVRVVLPGELFEPYIILAQIARDMKIETVLCVDGYPVTVSGPFLKTENNIDWIFDRILAAGQATEDHYLSMDFPITRIIKIKPTIIDTLEDQKPVSTEEKFDAIVMTWSPFHYNPASREESSIHIVLDVVRSLKSMGFKKIGIKVKSVGPEKEIYDLLSTEGDILDNIEILTGMWYQHVLKAKIVIGGFSSGMLETSYCRIPYFTYEPYENGYSDWWVEQSVIIKKDGVARTLPALEKNIKEGYTGITSDREYLFQGPMFAVW